MKRLLLLSLLVSGCSLFQAPPQATVPEPSAPEVDVMGRAVANVVSLQRAGHIFCSGVATEGVVMTAEHCVNDGKTFQVGFRGKLYDAVAAINWPDKDLAVVTVLGIRLKDTVPLSPEPPVRGQKVIWMGYPLGTQLELGVGYVSNPKGKWGYTTIYGQVIPGDSGGPVYDETGKLLGIISATMAYGTLGALPIGYIVHWDNLKEALEAL